MLHLRDFNGQRHAPKHILASRMRNLSACIKAYLAADEKCTEAELSESKAESDWLRARLAERDAEIDLLMLQYERSRTRSSTEQPKLRERRSKLRNRGEKML